jgi:hypothetical protein
MWETCLEGHILSTTGDDAQVEEKQLNLDVRNMFGGTHTEHYWRWCSSRGDLIMFLSEWIHCECNNRMDVFMSNVCI